MSVFLEAVPLFPCLPTPIPTPGMKVKTKSLPWWWLSGEESTCRCSGVIWFLVSEDPIRGAAQRVRHDYSACALAAGSQTHIARVLQLAKPVRPRAGALRLGKLPEGEASGGRSPSIATRQKPVRQ